MQAHTLIDFRQTDIPLKAGEVAKHFYIVDQGLFRSFVVDYKGVEVTTGFYCAQELLIESFSLFQRMPSKENFQALTDAKAWRIAYEDFQSLLADIEALRDWGRGWATSQLSVLKQHFINVLTVNATDRYLELMRERPQVISLSPLKYIASYLGITDSSLSRIRKEISGS